MEPRDESDRSWNECISFENSMRFVPTRSSSSKSQVKGARRGVPHRIAESVPQRLSIFSKGVTISSDV